MDVVIHKDLAQQANVQADASLELEAETMCTQGKPPSTIPVGTLLGNEFTVFQSLGTTNFAQIYAVDRVNRPDSEAETTYEARFYKIEALSPSLEAYRARSIRRLSQRTVLRTDWQGMHVIVYRTGILRNGSESTDHEVQQTTGERSSEEASTSLRTSKKSNMRTKAKSTRQRESDRLRQQSRRKRNRQHKKQSQTISEDEEELSNRDDGNKPQAGSSDLIEADEDEFVLFQMLHLVNSDAAFRQRLSASARLEVEKYLAARDQEVTLDDEDALSDFIAIKEREIALLRRQRNKFQPVLKNWHAHLDTILRQQLAFPPNSMNRLKHQNEQVLPFRTRYMILKSGLEILPSLIAEAEGKVQSLEEKLLNARQARGEREARQAEKLERKKLSKKIKNYAKWKYDVLPGSAARASLLEDLNSAKRKMERMVTDNGT